MNLEEQLTKKSYFEQFTSAYKDRQPVQVLGELFFEEQQKEAYDLSYIRFAQGELYFHCMDFETAIYKWESIHNELEPWAKKNMADAYVELGLYAHAEDLYKAIVTDSLILNTEIGLELFSLYIRLRKKEKADQTIKRVVQLNPDYPNVTDLARNFYEENQDWKSAVEVAVNEGKRTESLSWFTQLKGYIDEGRTKSFPPDYFIESLLLLKRLSMTHFEQLLSSLWKRNDDEKEFLLWVKSLNSLFQQIEYDEDEIWYETQDLFQEVFLSLIKGKYLIKEVEKLIPDLLKNWAMIADPPHAALANGAILAWNDYFPTTLEQAVVEHAESYISGEVLGVKNFDERFNLLTEILQWAKNEAIEIDSSLHLEGEPLIGENEDILRRLQAHPEAERGEKLLQLIGSILNNMLSKKKEQEKQLIQNIQWNTDVLSKLRGGIHQIDDWKDGKNNLIKKSFQARKEEIRDSFQSGIPEILKSCSDLISEDSDFKKLSVEINDEMNLRVELYLREKVMPQFQLKFQDWLQEVEQELQESQYFIHELTEGLNQLLEENKLQMECDFQVLNDWKRDMERMTTFVTYEKENIFLRFTPSQFLIKSAGRLLGSIPQNKGFLASQYKKLIENEDFSDAVQLITKKFLQQLELFERTLERDMMLFFENPVSEAKQAVAEMEKEKAQYQKELDELKSHPERFYDPIVLFQIRQRQLEWLDIGSVGQFVKDDKIL